jgi:hypothetical protein
VGRGGGRGEGRGETEKEREQCSDPIHNILTINRGGGEKRRREGKGAVV